MAGADWAWLRTYITTVAAAQEFGGNLDEAAILRSAVAAFWTDYHRGDWPASPNFRTAGNPRYFNAFLPAEFGILPVLEFTGFEDWTLCVPTKDGDPFLGWYTTPNFVGAPITYIAEGTDTDVTLYARWESTTTGVGEVSNILHVFGSNGRIGITADNRIESVRVFDLQGRTVHTVTGLSLNEYSVAVSQGVYIVEVTTTAGRAIERVIVK
jgi:uncharacterized repeat protein (TIGR02543 family)